MNRVAGRAMSRAAGLGHGPKCSLVRAMRRMG